MFAFTLLHVLRIFLYTKIYNMYRVLKFVVCLVVSSGCSVPLFFGVELFNKNHIDPPSRDISFRFHVSLFLSQQHNCLIYLLINLNKYNDLIN